MKCCSRSGGAPLRANLYTEQKRGRGGAELRVAFVSDWLAAAAVRTARYVWCLVVAWWHDGDGWSGRCSWRCTGFGSGRVVLQVSQWLPPAFLVASLEPALWPRRAPLAHWLMADVCCLQRTTAKPAASPQCQSSCQLPVAKLRPPRWSRGSRPSGLSHQPPLLLQPAKQLACCMLLIYEVALLRCIAFSAKNGAHHLHHNSYLANLWHREQQQGPRPFPCPPR